MPNPNPNKTIAKKAKHPWRPVIIAFIILAGLLAILMNVDRISEPRIDEDEALHRLNELDAAAPKSGLTVQEAGERLRALDANAPKSKTTPEEAKARLEELSR